MTYACMSYRQQLYWGNMLNVAIDAAKQAGELALKYFKSQSASWRITYKADKSPVTKADIEAEKLIRKIISHNFPDHGIIGEELPPVNPKAKYQWVIDPIDGTRSFIRGIPQWCVLIAVMENNKPIIGVCYYPSQDELFHAQEGKGTFYNGKRTKVSEVQNFSEAYISYYNLKHFAKLDKVQNLVDICRKTYFSSSNASISIDYLLQGKIDAYICGHGLLWDFAAPSILIEEAGGKFSDFYGKNSLTSDVGIFTNGILHNQVLKLLNS